jgi:hypothetical protein
MASLEEDFELEPIGPLGDLLDLVREVLVAVGYDMTNGEGDLEIAATLRRAEEIVALDDDGEEVRHDDAQQAAAELRSLFRAVVIDPGADAGADLRLNRDGAEYGDEPQDDRDGIQLGLHLDRTEPVSEIELGPDDLA